VVVAAAALRRSPAAAEEEEKTGLILAEEEEEAEEGELGRDRTRPLRRVEGTVTAGTLAVAAVAAVGAAALEAGRRIVGAEAHRTEIEAGGAEAGAPGAALLRPVEGEVEEVRRRTGEARRGETTRLRTFPRRPSRPRIITTTTTILTTSTATEDIRPRRLPITSGAAGLPTTPLLLRTGADPLLPGVREGRGTLTGTVRPRSQGRRAGPGEAAAATRDRRG
jgi:hypothetical protein